MHGIGICFLLVYAQEFVLAHGGEPLMDHSNHAKDRIGRSEGILVDRSQQRLPRLRAKLDDTTLLKNRKGKRNEEATSEIDAEALKEAEMVKKQMEEAMADPQFQEQMKMMSNIVQNASYHQQIGERVNSSNLSTEFNDMVSQARAGGMEGMLGFFEKMHDREFMIKLGRAVGDGPAAALGVKELANGTASEKSEIPPPTSLREAAEKGDEEAVKRFLADNVNVEEVGVENGETALHLAAAYGWKTIVQMLLTARANIEAAEKNGNTPLIIAAGYGHPVVVKLLLDAGADVAATNSQGQKALDLAKIVQTKKAERNPLIPFFDEETMTRLNPEASAQQLEGPTENLKLD